MSAPKPKFYVVWKGRKTGIFTSWEKCAAQVQGYTGARYKAFDSRPAAERALQGNYADFAGKPASSKEWLFAPDPPIADSYCVDAACSGNPGRLEYRGVHTDTGRELFHQGPYENGTNNIGEFLALVHILIMLKKKRLTTPVYSDSETAIAWVKAKRCNTDLRQDHKNAPLFELLTQAEDWLEENKPANRIMKWDTQAWGEIPADFNRK
jgi:ribonuclease HI